MADVRPLRALRYNLAVVGSLDAVAAPPYDVIDSERRAKLAARSPFNVVEVDLPRMDDGDPYLHAQTTFEAWRQEGVLVRDREPALWAMTQEYRVAGGTLTRGGFFCRVRVEEYGAGRIRPHERTQPGPREDRLRLQRATRANLSPIFGLYADPGGDVLAPTGDAEPDATFTDDEGTVCRLWRIDDEPTIRTATEAMADRELLIADGHHRYETALAYAEEVGGEGEHRFVLMFLCSLSDPGLTVLPTHRLLTGMDDDRLAGLREAIERDFAVERVGVRELEPPPGGPTAFGYVDRRDPSPRRLELRDPGAVKRALGTAPEPYRRVDAAVLEAVVLRDALGMSAEDVAAKRGLDYERDAGAAVRAVESGTADAAFILAPTPVALVSEVAEAGQPMPPKSTYFHPKVPTGVLFNLLE
jgi:uncharacterized protein (DUF1015 family)